MGIGSEKGNQILRRFRISMPLWRIMLVIAVGGLSSGPRPVEAAQLAGVTLPDTATVGTTTLVLNGVGLRTYSGLAIHIYVAGLYLQQPSHDANAILLSPGIKLMQLHFVHNVNANSLRRTWRTELVSN